jgi:thiamine pyridinylase
MTTFYRSLLAAFMFLGIATAASANDRYCVGTRARTLHVYLYPFIPDAEGAALSVKQAFEEGCPGLTLDISLDQNYYYSDKKEGLLFSRAAVYEVDSVFFDDMLKRARPLSPKLVKDAGPVVPFAGAIATSGNERYGIPHWLCSDFLLYRADKPQMAGIASVEDAKRVLEAQDKSDRLLMDLKGGSTLGEVYLSILVEHAGQTAALNGIERINPQSIKLQDLDPYVLRVIKSYVAMESPGFGRDSDYHGREGFYARQFARRAGSAFVGYSEETHYVLNESTQSCRHDECLKATDIAVTPWPFADHPANPVAWVDMYMLNSTLTGSDLADAEAFVRFMMKFSTYELLLVPPDGGLPRYLLPARNDMYGDPALLSNAPLYPKFRQIIDHATPLTAKDLNDRLRAIGKTIDSSL